MPNSRLRILVIDDDRQILRSFRMCLEDAGHLVATSTDIAGAEAKLTQAVFDLCFLDLNLDGQSGLDALPHLQQLAPWLRVVMVTGESSVPVAVQAIQLGAADFLVKPCLPDVLLRTAARHAEARLLRQRIETLESGREDDTKHHELSSASPAMQRVLETARHVADTDASVLILGESGTGKGVLALAIHQWSHRARHAMVTINCPDLSGELLASEMFGHVRGAFTGATENKLGRIDQAERGSLFLDEIGDFPLPMQPRLLRFIQDRVYERVGDPATRKSDVRILAATNRDLPAMVAAGEFREDLFYRLNVVTLHLPPLREHPEDILDLAQRFLLRYAQAYRRPVREFTSAAQALLRGYAWPGNVRELKNVVERAAILCRGEQVGPGDLSLGGPATISDLTAANAMPRAGDEMSLQDLERSHIEAVVLRSESLDAAASTLGIDSSTLYRKRKRYQANDAIDCRSGES